MLYGLWSFWRGGSFWNGCLNISPGGLLPVQTICAHVHSVSKPFVSLKSKVSRVRGRGGWLAEEKVQQDISHGHIKAFRTQMRGAHRLILVYNMRGITFLWLMLLGGHIDFPFIFWPCREETAFPDQITVSTADEVLNVPRCIMGRASG